MFKLDQEQTFVCTALVLILILFTCLQGLPEALMKAGAVYKYDLSIPLEWMYDLVEEMRNRLGN